MNGKFLLADLSAGTLTDVSISESVCADYLGGRGLCAYYLSAYLSDNPLIFFCGALEASGYSMTGLCSVAHVSPHTGGLFRSSFGGRFSASLSASGYDGLVIIGRSEKAVCLNIGNKPYFSDEPMKNASIVEPLPSAWNGVKHAGMVCDGLFRPHRGSTGYKMASMNLTAVCAELSDYEINKPADKESEDIDRLINASPALTGRLGIGRYGTAALYDIAMSRHMPPHSFLGSEPDEYCNSFGLLSRNTYPQLSCGCCPVACKKVNFPEYDELSMLSASGVKPEDIPAVFTLCLKQGYDVTTVAHQIAFYRKNINDVPAVELIQSYSGNMELNSVKSPLCVKGLEIPVFDPRGAIGMALGYVTSTTGADWQTAMAIIHELLRKPVPTDRFSAEGKAYMNVTTENAVAACQALSVCPLALISVSLEEYAAALTRFCGKSYTSANLDSAGANIVTLERKVIKVLGFGQETDILPDVFFNESKDGLTSIDRKAFNNELAKYYRLRGEI